MTSLDSATSFLSDGLLRLRARRGDAWLVQQSWRPDLEVHPGSHFEPHFGVGSAWVLSPQSDGVGETSYLTLGWLEGSGDRPWSVT